MRHFLGKHGILPDADFNLTTALCITPETGQAFGMTSGTGRFATTPAKSIGPPLHPSVFPPPQTAHLRGSKCANCAGAFLRHHPKNRHQHQKYVDALPNRKSSTVAGKRIAKESPRIVGTRLPLSQASDLRKIRTALLGEAPHATVANNRISTSL